ncbi:MAG: hypothetical protein L7F78_07700 [Syntrophales bacterium LBB04]|nr:hypothetical protein [Syntrophales bacterium LBB04]
MKEIHVAIEVAQTTAKTVYILVPCRGTIARLRGVYNGVTNTDDIVTISRSSTAVATITGPSTSLAAGTAIAGVLDTTNGQLIFDPNSSTVANKVMKIGITNTFDAAGTLDIYIEYDDSAYVTQTPSEA